MSVIIQEKNGTEITQIEQIFADQSIFPSPPPQRVFDFGALEHDHSFLPGFHPGLLTAVPFALLRV
jgi:hypothetical protein